MPAPVIVFGPTGHVGSIAARTAQEHGAKVILAMRDTSKTIPGLTPAQEKADGYERVQADLVDPDSVSAAVKKTGAKRAFIYLAVGSSDHMRSTVEALKSSGIELVVFLSSFTVGKDCHPAEVPSSEPIPFIHAQVEVSLEQVMPGQYVAIRPGAFASNVSWWKAGVQNGEVRVYCPGAKYDYVTYQDMGAVSGAVLANGPKDNQKVIYVFGPQMVAQQDAIAEISKVLGKDIKVTSIAESEAADSYKAMGMPEPVAQYLTKQVTELNKGNGSMKQFGNTYDEGVENVKKYTGRPAMPFSSWIEQESAAIFA